MPDQVHQVGGILAIVDREIGIEPDLVGIVAQQPRADAVEGAGPGQRVGHDAGALPHDASRDPLDPSRHLGGGAARKRHQQNPPRIGAVDDQVRDAVRQGVGLAGPGAGDDEERRARRAVLLPDAVLDGPPLLRIEGLKVGGGYRHGSNRPFREKESRSLIPVLFATTSPGLRGGRSRGARSSRLTLSSALEQIKNISSGQRAAGIMSTSCVQIRRRRPAPAHPAPGRRADPWACRPAVRNRGIDRVLPGGGLALGALHEVAGGGNGAIDGAAAALFAAGIAARTKGKVLWCVTRQDLFAPALGPGRPASGPRDLCRSRRRKGVARLFRGRPASRRSWRRRRRSGAAVDDGIAAPSARRRKLRRDRHRDPPLATADRGRRFRTADRRRHPLAGVGAALDPFAGAGRRTRPLAARTDPMPRRRECGFRSGGLRCQGSSRSSFRPGRPTGSEGHWATPRLRLRRRSSWSAGTGDGVWCWRRMRPRAAPACASACRRPRRRRWCAGLVIMDADPAADAAALERLALWALRRYAPIVAADPPDGLVIDIDRRRPSAWRRGGHARGDGRAARRGRLHRACGDRRSAGARRMRSPVTARGRRSSFRRAKTCAAIAPLPIAALRLPPDMVDGLRRLGFDRIADLAATPRAPLALRFGPELGRRLDQALGQLTEPIDPVRPPDLIEVRRAFAEPIGAAETIARYTGKLVTQLCAALEAKGLGATAARSAVASCRQPRRGDPRRHGAAGARRQAPDAAALRQDRDDRSGLRHRDHEPRRHARRAAARRNRRSPRLTEAPEADVSDLIDILANRVGEQRLYRFAPVASDVPERSVARVAPTAPDTGAGLARPLAAAVAAAAASRADRDRGAAARSSARDLHLARRSPAREARRRSRARVRRMVEARRRADRRCATTSRSRTRPASASGSIAPATARMQTTGSHRWFLHGIFG